MQVLLSELAWTERDGADGVALRESHRERVWSCASAGDHVSGVPICSGEVVKSDSQILAFYLLLL